MFCKKIYQVQDCKIFILSLIKALIFTSSDNGEENIVYVFAYKLSLILSPKMTF